ncbi:translation initiation factor IF-3 [Candidatus Daviesbacteria bacterium]|nr:translation initiation factor IF-3 [Candidatus Daviesbacteria bacterium]
MVIDSDGTKLGVISKAEALNKAHERGLDLVEIAPNVKPPVAKILDFQKFRYDESKKEQAAKKHARDVSLKEIWLSPRIAEHDLNTRLKRADGFLNEGDKILFRVKFKGREMAHLEFGFQLLKKIFNQFGDKITIEREPKVEGRSITAIIGRSKGGPKTNNQETSNGITK